MREVSALVAALLLGTNCGMAAAADNPEHESKNARKVIIILNSMGLTDKDLHRFVNTMDARIDNGFVRLADEEVPGGKLLLQYEIDSKITGDQLQLKYKPDDSNFEYTARPSSLMMNYKLEF